MVVCAVQGTVTIVYCSYITPSYRATHTYYVHIISLYWFIFILCRTSLPILNNDVFLSDELYEI